MLSPSYVKKNLFAIVFLSAYFIGLFLLLLFPVVDTDFGWHYRCGHDYLTTGEWCIRNKYSYLLEGYRWGYNTLIYDVSLKLLYDQFSFWGVMVMGSVVVTLCFVFLFWRYGKKNDYFINSSILLAGSYSIIRLGYRPQILTLLFFVVLLIAVIKIKEASFKRKTYILNAAILGLFWIWSNAHPGFVYGLVIYTVFTLYMVLTDKQPKMIILMPLVAFGLTLLNYQGISVYLENIRHYQVDLSELIAEWTPPSLLDRTAMVITTFIFGYSFFQMARIKHEKNWFLMAVYAITLILTWNSRRHLPLFWVSVFMMLSELGVLEESLKKLSLPINQINTAVIVAILFLGIMNLNNYRQNSNWNQNYCRQALFNMPCKALSHIQPKHKRLFTAYEWGGYLIWKKPNLKVFVDGRMPAWQTESGESPYTIYLNIIQAKKGWNETLTKYGTSQLLIPAGSYLDLELKQKGDSSWLETYRDKQSVIYIPKVRRSI